jgi:hypothetical protein
MFSKLGRNIDIRSIDMANLEPLKTEDENYVAQLKELLSTHPG